MFRKLQSFLNFPRFDRFWLLPVVLGLLIAKLLIWLVSFRRLSPLMGVQTGVVPWTPVISTAQTRRARQISRVVNRASRYTLTEVNCFPKALVARALFAIYRIPYCLFFGLRRDEESGEFDAHAWIVSGDAFLGMRSSFRRYAVLNVFASPALWATMRREMRGSPGRDDTLTGPYLQHPGVG